ncbi:MAG: gamma-glutamyl-gamma-aminobutyrate hydrolase family protein [Bacteroidetes bacterium]|nr:gamma-glutamyl-gamma-aminobutyrate hydrolase family protein [Bacteroidota bacterium]
MKPIFITSSNPAQHENYVRWLRRLYPSVDIRFILPEHAVDTALSAAGGILLPGGGDPDPALYGRPELLPFCAVDAERDRLEFSVIRWAVEHELPVLGICRGLQVMNVALGGSLIADLPSAGYDIHHRTGDEDRVHDIDIARDSFLHRITRSGGDTVNSAHHQGVDIVAPRLRVSARSEDGLPEALEWKHTEDKPFLLLLHWHPERLPEAHPLSDSIGRAFLAAAHVKH